MQQQQLPGGAGYHSEGEYPFNVMCWNANVLTIEKAAVLHRVMSRLDLVLLVEVGRDVPPPCEGFDLISGVVRQNRSSRGSGRGQGMFAYVRTKWVDCCELVKATDYYMWLRFQVPNRGPFFLCLVYIPPASSSVEWGKRDRWIDVYAELQSDIATYQSVGPVSLFGDFNCHTCTVDDTGSASEQLLDSMGVMSGDGPLLPVSTRNNSDTHPVCTMGSMLISLCAATGCVI